jgi:hypothetical protein
MRVASLVLCLSLLFTVSLPADETISSGHDVSIDPAKPFPAIMYSDVLKVMSDQVFWEKGQLRMFDRVRMTFLPDFQDPQHIAGYNPDTGAFLVSQLADASGKVVHTSFWEARQDRFPFWTATITGNSEPPVFPAGNYTLTWLLEGTAFWSLDFEISAAPSSNPYDPPNHYLEGPWNDWAYVYVPNGNLSQAPTFNFFLRDKAATPGNWIDKDLVVEVLRGDELIAQYGKDSTAIAQAKPWWIAQELALRNADDSGFMPASEMLQPGKYSIRLMIDGELYGTYRYEAPGGALPMVGRQDRESADPMSYLEGGTDRFYLKRE